MRQMGRAAKGKLMTAEPYYGTQLPYFYGTKALDAQIKNLKIGKI